MSAETAETAETVRKTFLDPEDAEHLLGVPNLGFLPRIDEPGMRLMWDNRTGSPLMESFRTLRTNLYFVREKPLRSLVVTSPVPAEGKSTTTANLAMALAMDGKRVVIVDADLRRPTQHKLFTLDQSPGLVDVLQEDRTVKSVLRPTAVPNVQVITAGKPPINAPELLGSGGVMRLLADLERYCDIVLLDTPPVLAVADGPIVASQADGVLLVIGYGETKQENAAQAIRVLTRSRGTVLGSALNRMQGPTTGYYYGKYYVASETAPTDGKAVTAESVRVRTRKSRKV